MTIFSALRSTLFEAFSVTRDLFKIMIPIIIGVKILQETGAISWLAGPLEPVMECVGLPGSMGLVWATAMVNNIYSGIVVFISLAGDQPLTTAQVTVLATMILVAHSLPVELEIVRSSGPRLVFQACMRVGSAFVLGVVLNRIYLGGGWLQEESVLLLKAPPAEQDLLHWVMGQVENLGWIFVIILGLLVFMKLLTALGVTDLLVRMLNPVLRMLGIGREAAPLTIVGMVMGLGYGGGLILHEVKQGKVGRRDIFFALSLMGLAHSVIEDTLLMLSLGGHVSGILFARVLFALFFVFCLVRVTGRMSDTVFFRYFFAPSGPDSVQTEAGKKREEGLV